MKFVTSEEQYAYEKRIMEEVGVPTEVLMESAARAVCRVMETAIKLNKDKILVAAGTGNNGGDAIAVARHLHNNGYTVKLAVLGDQNHASPTNQLQQQIARGYGLQIETTLTNTDLTEATAIVDGLFGIGLTRPIEGDLQNIVNQINAQTATIYAIDIPSGISCTTGEALGTCIQADYTITFGFTKNGMQHTALQPYFGQITVDDIGFFY